MANNEFGGSSFFGSAFSTTVIGGGGGGRGGGGRGPATAGGAPGIAMTPDWQRWVAENVLLRNSPQSILEAMVKAGFEGQRAAREEQGAVTPPYLRAAAHLGVGAGAGGQAPVAQTSSAKADKFAW